MLQRLLVEIGLKIIEKFEKHLLEKIEHIGSSSSLRGFYIMKRQLHITCYKI